MNMLQVYEVDIGHSIYNALNCWSKREWSPDLIRISGIKLTVRI